MENITCVTWLWCIINCTVQLTGTENKALLYYSLEAWCQGKVAY